MNEIGKRTTILTFLLGIALAGAAAAVAQTPASQPPQQNPSQPAQGEKSNPPQPGLLTLDSAPAPVNAEEDAAIKVFRDAGNEDQAKKDQSGLDFLQKYPQSRYRVEIYVWQVRSYLIRNMFDKMEVAGDQALELNPNDPQTLALVGMMLPRVMNSSTPQPEKRLAKAEQYCQKALDLLPTIPKPPDVTDEAFQTAKNRTAADAYSGLAMVDVRKSKYAEAIPFLEKSVRLDPQPDPVNFYLLGVSNEKTSHFDDAVFAFTKCASIPGGMQTTCTKGVDEAKKLAATQLSVPK